MPRSDGIWAAPVELGNRRHSGASLFPCSVGLKGSKRIGLDTCTSSYHIISADIFTSGLSKTGKLSLREP